MWISTDDSYPRLDEQGRCSRVWLYDTAEPQRGAFLGSYERASSDAEMYKAEGRYCFPTHFWDGEQNFEIPPTAVPRTFRK